MKNKLIIIIMIISLFCFKKYFHVMSILPVTICFKFLIKSFFFILLQIYKALNLILCIIGLSTLCFGFKNG